MEVEEEKADKRTKEKQLALCFSVSLFSDGFFLGVTVERGFHIR